MTLRALRRWEFLSSYMFYLSAKYIKATLIATSIPLKHTYVDTTFITVIMLVSVEWQCQYNNIRIGKTGHGWSLNSGIIHHSYEISASVSSLLHLTKQKQISGIKPVLDGTLHVNCDGQNAIKIKQYVKLFDICIMKMYVILRLGIIYIIQVSLYLCCKFLYP